MVLLFISGPATRYLYGQGEDLAPHRPVEQTDGRGQVLHGTGVRAVGGDALQHLVVCDVDVPRLQSRTHAHIRGSLLHHDHTLVDVRQTAVLVLRWFKGTYYTTRWECD